MEWIKPLQGSCWPCISNIIPLSLLHFHVQLEKQHLFSRLFKDSWTAKSLITIQMLIEELEDVCGFFAVEFFAGEKRWQRMFLTNSCQFNAATYTVPTVPCRGFLLQSHNVLVSRGYASDYLKVDSISNSQQPCIKLNCGDWLKKDSLKAS